MRQWYRGVWFRGVNDTAEFFAHANISAKSKIYAKILQYMNNGPSWVRIVIKKREGKNFVALSLYKGQSHEIKVWFLKGWEFTLWLFVQIARFWQKRWNRTFTLFVRSNESEKARRAMNLKDIYFTPTGVIQHEKFCDLLLKRVNRSCIKRESFLCSKTWKERSAHFALVALFVCRKLLLLLIKHSWAQLT